MGVSLVSEGLRATFEPEVGMVGSSLRHEGEELLGLRGALTLAVETEVVPTTRAAVPVSFGWHPYLRLPGVDRRDWRIELPVAARAILDERGIPTGSSEPV